MDDEDEGVFAAFQERCPLSDDELARIKKQLLESVYADIGKTIIYKVLWMAGACVLVLLAWLTGSGYVRFGG